MTCLYFTPVCKGCILFVAQQAVQSATGMAAAAAAAAAPPKAKPVEPAHSTTEPASGVDSDGNDVLSAVTQLLAQSQQVRD